MFDRTRLKTNAFLHGVSAGFGVARAVSHPVRRWYERRYHPRHRFPRVVFLFDLALIGMIAVLAILVVSLLVVPPAPPTLRLSVAASPMIALEPVAIAATVSSADGRDHAAVTVRWGVPSGWDVVSADPPMRADGSVYLGSVPKGDRRTSRIVVRPFAAVGTTAAIGISLSQFSGSAVQTYTGSASFPVRASALSARIPDAFAADAVVPDGAVLPVVVANDSDLVIPSVELRPADTSGIAFPRAIIGDLPAKTSRVVYIAFGRLTAPPHLAWGVYAASREIATGSLDARIDAWADPTIDGPIVAHANAPTAVHVTNGMGTSILVIPPASTGTVLSVPLTSNDATIQIPSASLISGAGDQWLLAPVRTDDRGSRTLGRGTLAAFAGTFPFAADAEYTSPSGDQLGVGPNPPRVGEETRYWIFWRVGPVQSSLRDLTASAMLGDRVRPTGNVALPDGGTSDVSGRTITWTLPAIGSDAGHAEASFGFEVAIQPQQGDIGKRLTLIGASHAEAVSASDITLIAEDSAQYSEIVRQQGQTPLRVP